MSSPFVRYTPSQPSTISQQRIIHVAEQQKDPMELPKFKLNAKIPMAPPSPPAPVLHSPPRKLTVQDHSDWAIPPCISNWKNPKGYAVSLDKRLATDGRGLQQTHINEHFAHLSEALNIADTQAREAVEQRAKLERKIAQKKKEEQEEQMRAAAKKIREDRRVKEEAARERDTIRRNRRDDVRKWRNIARNRPEKANRLRRERERDISEKIVLGLPNTGIRTGETQVDQRLFQKAFDSDAMDLGNPYDKTWRPIHSIQQHIYRPGKHLNENGDMLDKVLSTKRFVPYKGFSGADGQTTNTRSGAVQFEKETDVFGLDDLFLNVTKKRRDEEMDDRRDSKRRRD